MGIESDFSIFQNFDSSFMAFIALSHIDLCLKLSVYFPAEISLWVPVLGFCTPGRSPIAEPLWAFISVLHPSPFRLSLSL